MGLMAIKLTLDVKQIIYKTKSWSMGNILTRQRRGMKNELWIEEQFSWLHSTGIDDGQEVIRW